MLIQPALLGLQRRQLLERAAALFNRGVLLLALLHNALLRDRGHRLERALLVSQSAQLLLAPQDLFDAPVVARQRSGRGTVGERGGHA